MSKLVPKLRFKADDGSEFPEWEEKTFSEILSENKIPIPKPTNGYERLGIRSHGKGTFHEYVPAGEGLDVDTMYVVEAYNLILNITFAWEQAIAVTDDKDDGKLVSHRFPQYKFNAGFDWHYFKYDILDKKLKHELGLASPGGAGRNRVLNKSDFLKIKRVVPCLNEQQKIASFLSTIDEIITTTEAELTAWEERKKGVMQKIFNREVRFKADDGSDFPEWEEKRLGDYLVKFSEVTLNNNQYPALTSSRKGIFLQDDYYGKQIASEDNTGYNIVPYGYFTYRHMSDDLVFRFNINTIVEYGIVSTLYPVFTTTDKIDDKFLYYYLNESDRFRKYCFLQKQGGSRTYMYYNKLERHVILLPSLPEQKKIADCLSSLDDVINQIQAELSAWKEFKKGLLQQMFV